MTAHSLLGASSAHRWLNCPGSFKLSQTAPHRPSSIYAATGTLAHELIEQQIKAGVVEPVSPAILGKVYPVDGHNIEIDQDFINGVDAMLEYLGDWSIHADWMDVEFRVDLASYFETTPPVPVFGTLDGAALYDRTLEVADYKNGAGVTVSPKENPQLLFYAAGALQALPAALQDRVKCVKLTIVQPHALGTAPVRSWELSLVDLLMWVDEVLVPGVETCAQDDAPLNPGRWCRFCPVVHACPALHAAAVAMAKVEFDDIPAAAGELAKMLDTAERAELWINRVREFAIDRLEHQERIPGWGLVPTRPTRKWLAPDTDIAEKLAKLGAGHDEIWETRMRSPAQIERQLHRTKKGRQIWDQAATMVEARSSGVKLGRDDTNDPKEDFTDVEGD